MRMLLIVHKYGELIINIIFVYMNYHFLQLVIAASIAAIIALGAVITFKTSKN